MAEEERLAPSGPIPTFISAPPFAPTPNYTLSSTDGGTCRTASSAGGRSATTLTTAQTTKPGGCTIHKICHYVQQFVFISAILTGLALIVVGAVMQSGDFVVFVYIGVLLVGVNSSLLAILCFVHRKQNQRLRTYTTSSSRHPGSGITSSGVNSNVTQYTPLGTSPQLMSGPVAMHGQQAMSIQGIPLLASHPQASPGPVAFYACSPTDSSHIKYFSSVHSMMSYRQASVRSGQGSQQQVNFPQQSLHPQSAQENYQPQFHHFHHHESSGSGVGSKESYHHSPPLGQHSRVLGRPDVYPSVPPPCYNELVLSEKHPREGATLHIL